MLITGRAVAEKILHSTQALIKEHGLTPGLGVILVGDDAPSHLYVGIKERRAEELGIYFEKRVFGAEASQEEVEGAILEMNQDPKLHGIIVQLPLPEHLNVESIIRNIDPQKDTDGFHPETISQFLAGDQSRLPVFPRAMLELIKINEKENKGQALAIVNSELMGKVLKTALENDGFKAEVLFSNEKEEIEGSLPESDVVLTAVGSPGIISAENAKAGSIFIDGGISYQADEKVVGDIRRDDGVYREDVQVTTVPGGVGPVTVAVLLARVTEAALKEKKSLQ